MPFLHFQNISGYLVHFYYNQNPHYVTTLLNEKSYSVTNKCTHFIRITIKF